MDNTSNTVGPVNLGNPSEFTIDQLANLVISLTESQSKIVYEDLPSDDPTRRQPDITKAKELLQWYPSTSLEYGLTKTIEYLS